jgi:hypothetical protein
MDNLIRIARPLVVKVAPADETLPPVYLPLAAGQVVRAGGVADDGYQVGVGGVGVGVVLEDEYEEEDESLYAWVQTQFSAN